MSIIQQIYFYFRNQEYEKAIDTAILYLKDNPKDSQIINTCGVCALNLANYELAKKLFEKSIQTDPNYIPAYENLVLILQKYIINSLNDSNKLKIINEKYIETIFAIMTLYDKQKKFVQSIEILKTEISFCFGYDLLENNYIFIKNLNRRINNSLAYPFWTQFVETLFNLLIDEKVATENLIIYLKIFLQTINFIYNSPHSVHFSDNWILIAFDVLNKISRNSDHIKEIYMYNKLYSVKNIVMYMFNELFQLSKFATKFSDCDLEVLLVYIKMETTSFLGSFAKFITENRESSEFLQLKTKLNHLVHTSQLFQDVETGKLTYTILQAFYFLFNSDIKTSVEIFSQSYRNDQLFIIAKIFLSFFCRNYSTALFYIDKYPTILILNQYYDNEFRNCLDYFKIKCLLVLNRTELIKSTIDIVILKAGTNKWINFTIIAFYISIKNFTNARDEINKINKSLLSEFEKVCFDYLNLFASKNPSFTTLLELLDRKIDNDNSNAPFFKLEIHDFVSFLIEFKEDNHVSIFKLILSFCELNLYNGFYFYKIGNCFNCIYKDKTKMIECYEKAFHLGFHSAEILNQLLLHYCSLNQIDYAQQILTTAENLFNGWEENKNFVSTSSILFINLGYYGKASDYLQKYIKYSPTDSQIWYLLGLAYLGSQSFESAIFAFSRSFEIENTYQCLRGLAKACWQQSDFEKAISHFEESLNLQQDVQLKLSMEIELIELIIQSAISYHKRGNFQRYQKYLETSFIKSLTLLHQNSENHVLMELLLYSAHFCSIADISISLDTHLCHALSDLNLDVDNQNLTSFDLSKISFNGYSQLCKKFPSTQMHKSALISYLNYIKNNPSFETSISDQLSVAAYHFIYSLTSNDVLDSSIFNIFGAILLILNNKDSFKHLDHSKTYDLSLETIMKVFTNSSEFCNDDYSPFSNLAILNFLIENKHMANYKLEAAISINPEIPTVWHLKALFHDSDDIDDLLKYCSNGLSFEFNKSLALYSISLFFKMIIANSNNIKIAIFHLDVCQNIQKYIPFSIELIHLSLLFAKGIELKLLLYIYHILHYIHLAPFSQNYNNQLTKCLDLNIYEYALCHLTNIENYDVETIDSQILQISNSPKFNQSLFQGLFYYHLSKYEKSIQCFQQCLDLIESENIFYKSQLFLCVSLCHYAQSNHTECIASVKKSMMLSSVDQVPLIIFSLLSLKYSKIQNMVSKTFETNSSTTDEKMSLFEIYYYIRLNGSKPNNTLINNKILSHIHKFSLTSQILTLIQYFIYFTNETKFNYLCQYHTFDLLDEKYYGLYIYNKFLINAQVLYENQIINIFLTHLKKYHHLFNGNSIFYFLLTKCIMVYSQLSLHYTIEYLFPKLGALQFKLSNTLSLCLLFCKFYIDSSFKLSSESISPLLRIEQKSCWPMILFILQNPNANIGSIITLPLFVSYQNYINELIKENNDLSNDSLLYIMWFEKFLPVEKYFDLKISICDYLIHCLYNKPYNGYYEYYLVYKYYLIASCTTFSNGLFELYNSSMKNIINICNRKLVNVLRFLNADHAKRNQGSSDQSLDLVTKNLYDEIFLKFKLQKCWCNNFSIIVLKNQIEQSRKS